ncbi:hypothetical protein HAX54_044804, partial [Datura stramonium]|nr:hypothetical protein [Datura stramonium]
MSSPTGTSKLDRSLNNWCPHQRITTETQPIANENRRAADVGIDGHYLCRSLDLELANGRHLMDADVMITSRHTVETGVGGSCIRSGDSLDESSNEILTPR